MLARLAGRLLTSPAAFLAGGALDIARYAGSALTNRWRAVRARSTIRSHADRAPAP